jgi:hypothetical protein
LQELIEVVKELSRLVGLALMSMSQLQFQFVQTADGSPTVRIGSETDASEAMHSLKGAFSETAYIYGTAIETAIERGFEPSVLSLGLGLGYVEILAAGLFLKDGRQADVLSGESFEAVADLRNWFINWIREQGELPQEFREIYDEILERTAWHTGVGSPRLKSFLQELLETGRWQIREALEATTQLHRKFGCICFDAFSSKTSPDLWTEPFLADFFTRAASAGCVLSTYACTGALKRSLRATGFELKIREGFASKRDSTFALRSLEFAAAITDKVT